MSDFNKTIYAFVRQIPPGQVTTYGRLALMAGRPRASRIVGAAMLRAPQGLPCHRVIYKDGTLCCDQAFGGKEIQRQMLAAEGVTFLPDGRVDLKRHLWPGNGEA